MKDIKRYFLYLSLLLCFAISGCSRSQTFTILDKQESFENSFKDWQVENNILCHKESKSKIVQVYEESEGNLIAIDSSKLLDLFTSTFIEEPVYQELQDKTYISKKAIRTMIQVSNDSQAPFDTEILPSNEIESFISTTSTQVDKKVIKALKNHKEEVIKGKSAGFDKFHLDNQEEEKIYAVYFVPYYRLIHIKYNDIPYHVYQPMIQNETVEGLYIVVEKHNPLE